MTSGDLSRSVPVCVRRGASYPGSMANAAEHLASRSHLVVRVRLGVDFDRTALGAAEFLNRVGEHPRVAVVEAGAELDVLQVGLAADPRWQAFGPDNRIEGRPIP